MNGAELVRVVAGAPVAWILMVAILLVGLGGVIVLGNLIRKVVSLSIANSAIIMMFIYHGGASGTTAPILDGTTGGQPLVDPLPQALMLTAIVVGVCIVALAVVLIYRLWLRHGTVDMRELERRVWGDDG